MTKTTRKWMRGLLGANIAGGAGALVSAPLPAILDPDKFNFGHGLKNMLIFMLGSFIIHAVVGGAAYLQKSPLPDEVPEGPQGQGQMPGDPGQ